MQKALGSFSARFTHVLTVASPFESITGAFEMTAAAECHEVGLCHAGGSLWMYGGAVAEGMRKISYAGYRFPPEVIHQAIWLYLRFTLSFGEERVLRAGRGIAVSSEPARRWVNRFGPMIAAHL